MASTSRQLPVAFLLLLAVLIGFLSVTVSAGRPCKTLYISSYTVSVRPLHTFRFPNPSLGRRSGFVAIVTEIGHQSSLESSSDMIVDQEQEGFNRILPFGISSHDISSLRDRTKDILSVVVALLFGVGCGALTAASMYLVWSLFAARSGAYYDESDYEEEEDASPKKIGYVAIPEAEKVAAPAKTVV
ncbi:hypothetical protein LINPERPRIM_LOCUS3010 [Linum perenne]